MQKKIKLRPSDYFLVIITFFLIFTDNLRLKDSKHFYDSRSGKNPQAQRIQISLDTYTEKRVIKITVTGGIV